MRAPARDAPPLSALRFSATDASGVTRVEVRLTKPGGRPGRWIAARRSGGAWTVPAALTARGRHTIEARAVDAAGNASPVLARRVTVR